MHIAEGVLSLPVLATGYGISIVGLAIGLKKIPSDRIIGVAILAATFFIASLIHIPVGVSSAHLVLNGLLGMLLGWAAVPAIFIALLLQAILFQYGGLAVLGVNTVIMAFPALVCGLAFRPLIKRGKLASRIASFCCGVFALAGSVLLAALSLFFTHEGFLTAANLLFVTHIPIMIAEGCIVMLVVAFLQKTKSDLLRDC